MMFAGAVMVGVWAATTNCGLFNPLANVVTGVPPGGIAEIVPAVGPAIGFTT